MKKFFTYLLVVFSLCFTCSVASAETYYQMPEPVYKETIQYIQNSMYQNQQLQNKVKTLKTQQKLLEKQITQLKQQQTQLNNSYSHNNETLKMQNETLKQESQLLKKKIAKYKVQKIILYSILGYVIVKNL